MKQLLPNLAILMACLASCFIAGCSSGRDNAVKNPDEASLLFEDMAYPNITHYGDTFYFIGQNRDLIIRKAENIDSLPTAAAHLVWEGPAQGMHNIWSPEIANIKGKWYIYFEADDGNTDNHQLYVIENPSADPTRGKWTLHGPIITNEEWNYGIHPSTFTVGDRQYLLWSGWERRRSETETQCIFIAEMENPWTLRSPRVLISRPEYEWERQWINLDGSRTAYPIFVNENPEPIISPDGKRIAIAYSASGVWTPYVTLGMLYADTSADLLNPSSWKKLGEPQSNPAKPSGSLTRISNITTVFDSVSGENHVLFQGLDTLPDSRASVYVKRFEWNKEGYPDFVF